MNGRTISQFALAPNLAFLSPSMFIISQLMSVLPLNVSGIHFVPRTHCHHSNHLLHRWLWKPWEISPSLLSCDPTLAWKSGTSSKNGNITVTPLLTTFQWLCIGLRIHSRIYDGFSLWSLPAYFPCPTSSPQFPCNPFIYSYNRVCSAIFRSSQPCFSLSPG